MRRQRSRSRRPAKKNCAADTQPSTPRRRQLPIWKKLLFSALTCALFFGSVELTLALLQFEPALKVRDPYVGFESSIPLFVQRRETDGDVYLVTARNKLAHFNAQQFAKDKPDGTYRVFCLGGSTTYGRPYDDSVSFSAWLRELLPLADRSRNWEVINAGGVSYASYRVAALMEELAAYEPDLFVIYCGHNEFLEERTYRDIKQSPAALRRMTALLSHTRTYAAMESLLRPSAAVDGRHILPGEVNARLDHTVGPSDYHRDEPLRARILEHYEFNLMRMVEIAGSAGAKVLLIVPAANVKDSSPFKSQHAPNISEAQLAQWESHYQTGKVLHAAGQPGEALAAYEQAAAIDDRYAELHYRRGLAMLDSQHLAEAREALDRAVDEDACPLRALPQMQQIVRQTAEQLSVPLVDAEQMLRNECLRNYGHNSPGREYFLDHVHLTISATGMLAVAIVEELAEAGMVEQLNAWQTKHVDEVAARIESRIDPKSQTAALRNLAKVLNWAGQHEEAGRLAIETVRLRAESGFPPDPEALLLAGAYLNSQGEIDAAVSHYRQALRQWPDYVEAHQLLGAALTDQGQFEEAYQHFVAVARLKPDDAHAHHMAGAVLAELARYEEAIEHYCQADRLREDDADIHFNMAFALEKCGKRPQAIQWYRRTLKLNPSDEYARRNLEKLTGGPRK